MTRHDKSVGGKGLEFYGVGFRIGRGIDPTEGYLEIAFMGAGEFGDDVDRARGTDATWAERDFGRRFRQDATGSWSADLESSVDGTLRRRRDGCRWLIGIGEDERARRRKRRWRCGAVTDRGWNDVAFAVDESGTECAAGQQGENRFAVVLPGDENAAEAVERMPGCRAQQADATWPDFAAGDRRPGDPTFDEEHALLDAHGVEHVIYRQEVAPIGQGKRNEGDRGLERTGGFRGDQDDEHDDDAQRDRG